MNNTWNPNMDKFDTETAGYYHLTIKVEKWRKEQVELVSYYPSTDWFWNDGEFAGKFNGNLIGIGSEERYQTKILAWMKYNPPEPYVPPGSDLFPTKEEN